MPIFEYRCEDCNSKFELLHKSSVESEEIICPSCNSVNNKKLFSSFSASVGSGSSYNSGSCSTGNCGSTPSYGGCASGICGLN